MRNSVLCSPFKLLRTLSVALLVSWIGTDRIEAATYLGTDLRKKKEATFVQYDDSNSQAYVTTVAERGRRGLTKVIRAAHYLANDESGGQVIRLSVNSTGLISSLMADDGSSISLRWNKKKANREFRVTMRDKRGRKVSFSEVRHQVSQLDYFDGNPPALVSWERINGLKRETLLDGSVFDEDIGRNIVGLLDDGDRAINTLLDRVSKIPAVVQRGGALGLLVVQSVVDATLAASDFQGGVASYVGDLTPNLFERGKLKLERLLVNDSDEESIPQLIRNSPVRKLIPPIPLEGGYAVFETSNLSVNEGEATQVRILRRGGSDGVLSGIVVFDGDNSTASANDFKLGGNLLYTFRDGSDTPQVITFKARDDSNEEPGEYALLVHDQGRPGGFQSLRAEIVDDDGENPGEELPEDFSVSGSGGMIGTSIGTHSAFAETANLTLGSSVVVEFNYSAQTNTAQVTMRAGIKINSDPSTQLTWTGSGSLSAGSIALELTRTDNPSRPKCSITIVRDSSGRYLASPVLKIYHFFRRTSTGEMSERTFTYTPASFFLQ